MPESRPSVGLWEFSLALWRYPGVEPACLALQERHGIDVNLLLFCAWAGGRGTVLDDRDIRHLIEVAAPWREAVVLPLRSLRRWLKQQTIAPGQSAEALRRDIKADELKAEAIQQSLFLEAVPVPEGIGRASLTAANLVAYFRVLGIQAEVEDSANLAVLLCASHSDLPPLDAVGLLHAASLGYGS